MATRPTPGGSDGTWGTELNAHLAVSLATDGKVLDGAVFSTSAAPTVDAALVNKKFVDDTVGHDGDGYAFFDVDGVKTKVYTKYLTGTTDSDTATVVAHGIASGGTKILSVTLAIKDSGANVRFIEMFLAAGNPGVAGNWSDSDINITNVGAVFQGQAYYIKIDYIL